MHSCFQWKSSQTWICAFLNDPVWYIGTKCLIYLTSPIVKHDLTSNFFTFSNWKAFWDRKKPIVLCLQWLQSHRSASKVQLNRNKQWQEMRKPGGKGRMMKVWESEWRMVDDEMRWDGGWGGVVDGNLIKEYWLSLGSARAPIDLERWQMNCSLWRDVLIPKNVGQSIICLPCGICNHVYCVRAGISTQSWFCCVIKTETSWYYQLWFSFEEEQTPGGGSVEKNQLVDERGKHGLSRPRTHSWAGRQSGALAKLS